MRASSPSPVRRANWCGATPTQVAPRRSSSASSTSTLPGGSRSNGATASQIGHGHALLVTFDLVPADGGTTIHMTETGFREMGWEVAVLEKTYQDHVNGWSHFIPRLGTYVHQLVGAA